MNIVSAFSLKSVLAKGVFAVFAFSFFFLATTLILNKKTPEQIVQEKIEKMVPLSAEEKTLVSQKLQELSKDSDNDGLKDWEEIIYRTNSQNADTDGDGTKDGEEIKQNRNPLVKGPKDSYATPANEALTKNGQEPENNLTYDFVKKFYGTVGTAASADGSISSQAVESLAQEINWLNPDAVLGAIPDAVKKTDLVVSPKNDADSIKKYFNSVNDIYYGLGLAENDLEILNRALEEKNFDELKKLDAIIAGLNKSFNEIKKMPVPAGYEDFAVKELNYIAKAVYVIEKFKTVEADPLNVLAMVQARLKIINDAIDFHSETGKALAQKGIVFGQEEGGYQLLQIFQ